MVPTWFSSSTVTVLYLCRLNIFFAKIVCLFCGFAVLVGKTDFYFFVKVIRENRKLENIKGPFLRDILEHGSNN